MRSPARGRSAAILTLALAITTTDALTATLANAQAEATKAPDDTADACFSAAERAQPLMRQKKLREARALLEICARDVCPRVARTDCRQWLAESTDAQPSIVIAPHEVRGAGSAREVTDLEGVRAVIDESLVVERIDATPIVVDPGHHRLRLERSDGEQLVQEVDVREGEKGRVIDVYWRDADAPATRPVPPSVFVTGAVGLVGIGLGTYFEIAGLSARHDLDVSCKSTASCSPSAVDSAHDQVRAGDLTLAGGLVFLAGAAVLYFTRPTVEARPSTDRTAWIVGPTPGGFFVGARGPL
jgi:hypothetical protein